MAGGVCAACGGVIPPMELDVATGRGRCPDCDREGTYLRPPAPIAPAPPRPSALLWVIRRAEARALVDDDGQLVAARDEPLDGRHRDRRGPFGPAQPAAVEDQA